MCRYLIADINNVLAHIEPVAGKPLECSKPKASANPKI